MHTQKPGDFSWAQHEKDTLLTGESFKMIEYPDLKISKTLPQVKYLHREWKDADLYFIFNEKKEPVSFDINFYRKGKMQVWDAETGKITEFPGPLLELGPWETKFIVIKNRQ